MDRENASGLARLEGMLGFRPGDTVGSVLGRHRGIGPGFDLLRLGLALLIFVGHTKWVAIGAIGADGTSGPMIPALPGVTMEPWVGIKRWKLALVPMFFALSGFLVMGSAFRTRATTTFLAHRGLRLLPALTVEVTLSALVLGPLLTQYPLDAYFRDPLFLSYFANILGIVHLELPGLFVTNPASGVVNINLWTLPAEFHCYLIVAVLMMTKVILDRRMLTIAVAAATAVLLVAHATTGLSNSAGPYPAHVMVYYFFVGALFFHWKDHIPVRPILALPVLAVVAACLSTDLAVYVAPVFLTWFTVFLGLVAVPRIPLITGGDYSYGVYLYGFPISQALVDAFPFFVGRPILLILAAGLGTAVFAALSWHLIEKHVLRAKKWLPPRYFPRTKANATFPEPVAGRPGGSQASAV